MRLRSSQDQEQLEDNEALPPAVGHLETSKEPGLPLQTVPKEAPLRAVSLNLGAGAYWKRLETPEPGQQGLQAATHSAQITLGAMSHRIQQSCQSGTMWLVETQVKVRRKRPRRAVAPMLEA